MTAATVRESDIQAQCLAYLRLLPGVAAWRQNAGAMAGEYKGKRRFVRFTSMPGISDICGILAPEGRWLAVEVKGPKGRLTPHQAAFLDLIRGHGGLALVVRSVGELVEGLRREGVG